jgi:hypothetical protein
MHKQLVVKYRDSAAVLEWVVGYVSNPKAFTNLFRTKHRTPYTTLGSGKLLLNGPEIQEAWDLYTNDTVEKPTVTRIGMTLGKLRNIKKHKLNRQGSRINVYEIDTDIVFAFAETNMLGDFDAMKENLEQVLLPANVIPIERAKDDQLKGE